MYIYNKAKFKMYLDWLDKVWWLSYHIKHYYQQWVDTYNITCL